MIARIPCGAGRYCRAIAIRRRSSGADQVVVVLGGLVEVDLDPATRPVKGLSVGP